VGNDAVCLGVHTDCRGDRGDVELAVVFAKYNPICLYLQKVLDVEQELAQDAEKWFLRNHAKALTFPDSSRRLKIGVESAEETFVLQVGAHKLPNFRGLGRRRRLNTKWQTEYMQVGWSICARDCLKERWDNSCGIT
jgi:hypothetical protein